jgi:predicted transcriptional regulator
MTNVGQARAGRAGADMESADGRARRLEHEVPRIKAALESVAAGRVVPLEAVDAWIESLGTDHELPAPRAKR